jgi:predicted phosphoribosyltransferase
MIPTGVHDGVFADRRAAGRALAARLGEFAGRKDVIVLGLPRGGVPVAAEVAKALGAPLDIFVVRKLGVPQQPELAMGAVASGGVRSLNPYVVDWLDVPDDVIEAVTAAETRELRRREALYRQGCPALQVTNKTVLLVDDGMATGSTMRAAVAAVRQLAPARVVAAAPVGSVDACTVAATGADDVVCLRMPEPFSAVGVGYGDFAQTSDDEVKALLRDARQA